MDIHEIIRSQYHATLKMLLQAVEKCPPEMWKNPQDRNQFWHVAYHALFYTHLYLSRTGAEFVAWQGHREDYNFMGPKPWAPNEPLKIGEPYTKEDVLAFWQVCWDAIDQQVPTLDLEAGSGFDWLPMNKLELQIYNIRHLQQHTGELMERLGQQGINVDWVGQV
jgi:hypothetical protein